MTYNININQLKAQEWDLSLKACFGMCKMADLSSWANPVVVDKKVYYVLYRNKLLQEIPLVGKSLTTASRIITELENKGIIESINKATTPAYRLTDKGKEWLSDTACKISNDCENNPLEKSDEEKVTFTFRLKTEMEYEDLSDDYKHYLHDGCMVYLKKEGLSSSNYDDFINKYKSTGKKYKDWRAAFKTWCANAIRYGAKVTKTQKNSSNGGESYSLDDVNL